MVEVDRHSMDEIKTVLEYDPIAQAEKFCGKKHWSEFNDEEQGLSLAMALLHNRKKNEMLKQANDTRFSMTWDEFDNIISDNGFKLGMIRSFSDEDIMEKEAIYYRKDGLVLHVTSFFGGKDVNGGELYGEIKLKSKENGMNIPSCSNGYFDYENLKLSFKKDIREGLIWFIAKLKEKGDLLSIWEEKNKFLWFLDFIEGKERDVDYRGISMKKIQNCNDECQNIMRNLL